MDNIVVKVENLGKDYFISHSESNGLQNNEDNFKELLTSFVKDIFIPREKMSTEDFWAIRNLNFEIKEGDRVGFIGKNGAGKSTLLKILARVTIPSEGKITMKGKVASLLEVGTGFHPELSGRENIFLNGAILGMSYKEIKNSFDEIVAFSEIEKFIDTPVKRYSVGMRVRLAFSIAVHLKSDILILDEILAVGDNSFTTKCLNKMDEITKEEGRTILFVSHILDQVERLCNRAILLQSGNIIIDSDVDTVLKIYKNS